MGASGGRGQVAAGHAEVCGAAAEILEAGGNAFDAAVAAGFASAHCEPALTSLGGGGFLLARPATGEPVLFDFFSDTPGRELPAGELEPHFLPVTVRFPGSDQIFNVGRGSCAVPGTLRGFLHVHARLGRLPLSEVLAPAIRLARDGVAVNAHQAYFLELLRPILTLTADGRALYAPHGNLLVEGDRLVNADLAAFLESLPREGDRVFYEGELAARIDADMREGQGLLTRADLSGYRVQDRPPLRVPYRGYELLTNPPPSFGGSLLGLSLRLLEHADPEGLAADSAERGVCLLQVMRETDALRDQGHVQPGALDSLAADAREAIAGRVRRASGGTTQVSVCDAEGNAASMTTSNGEGSGYVVPGTGVLLNNMLGEDDLHPDGFHADPPGQRVASMMSPSLLLRNGAVRLIVGSGGSKRIRTALLQVIHAVADLGLDVSRAVEQPRFHWDGTTLQVEPGFAEPALAALRQHVAVNVWDRIDVYFGGVHAVAPGRGAGGDPRRGGAVREI